MVVVGDIAVVIDCSVVVDWKVDVVVDGPNIAVNVLSFYLIIKHFVLV